MIAVGVGNVMCSHLIIAAGTSLTAKVTASFTSLITFIFLLKTSCVKLSLNQIIIAFSLEIY